MQLYRTCALLTIFSFEIQLVHYEMCTDNDACNIGAAFVCSTAQQCRLDPCPSADGWMLLIRTVIVVSYGDVSLCSK